MIKTEHNLRSIGGLHDIAAEVDGITSYAKVPKPVKWSEELRRERLRLFGSAKTAGKVSKKETKQDAYNAPIVMPSHITDGPDVWPYVSMLADYVECKTGETLNALFTQTRTDNRHYVKAFIVVMRYGFQIKRSIIAEQIGTTRSKINSVLDMHKNALYYSPKFNSIIDELLEQLRAKQ